MSKAQLFAALCLALAPQLAHAGPPVRWSVGLNFGFPGCYHPYHCYRPYGYYYAPPPAVIYEPAPVVVRPAPVVYTAAPTVVQVPAATTAAPAVQPTAVVQANHAGTAGRIDALLQQLSSPQDTARRDAAVELGRLKAHQAIDPLATTLATDASPSVRDAAARGLGLIGSTRGLTPLIQAAQADNDRDVRHSAQFAVEVIRANLR